MRRIIRSRIISTLLSSAILTSGGGVALATDDWAIQYSLGGLVDVSAPENAAGSLLMGLWGALDVDSEGNVTGQGVVTYEYAVPCEWEPPFPGNGGAPHCRIDELIDGSFSISGSVTETVHRHDDDNPFKDAVFALADVNSAERLDFAPLTMKLSLTMVRQPREALSLWGFSSMEIAERTTGAAFLGLLSSTLFSQDFEIAPIAMSYSAEGAAADRLIDARQYVFRGNYDGGTLVTGAGSMFFLAIDPARLPTGTNPLVYISHEDNLPVPREFSETELTAIEAYEATGIQPPSRFDGSEVEQYLQGAIYGGSGASVGGDAMSGTSLTDDTRPSN